MRINITRDAYEEFHASFFSFLVRLSSTLNKIQGMKEKERDKNREREKERKNGGASEKIK